MSAEKINTQDAEFKMITDKKDEPDYKAVSKFSRLNASAYMVLLD